MHSRPYLFSMDLTAGRPNRPNEVWCCSKRRIVAGVRCDEVTGETIRSGSMTGV